MTVPEHIVYALLESDLDLKDEVLDTELPDSDIHGPYVLVVSHMLNNRNRVDRTGPKQRYPSQGLDDYATAGLLVREIESKGPVEYKRLNKGKLEYVSNVKRYVFGTRHFLVMKVMNAHENVEALVHEKLAYVPLRQ